MFSTVIFTFLGIRITLVVQCVIQELPVLTVPISSVQPLGFVQSLS